MKCDLTHLITTIILGLSLALPVQAEEHERDSGKCFATFAFVLDGGEPAMRPVVSTIIRDGAVVSTQQQHIFNKNLECGKGYTIKGIAGDKTYSHSFTLVGGGNTIKINMQR
jgi:hypothetical protein